MNYAEVRRIAGELAARRMHSDDYFNNYISGHEKPVAAERLDDLTRGAVVLGVEAVDDPADGLVIYLQAQGAIIALFVDIDIAEQGGGLYEVLRISKADVA